MKKILGFMGLILMTSLTYARHELPDNAVESNKLSISAETLFNCASNLDYSYGVKTCTIVPEKPGYNVSMDNGLISSLKLIEQWSKNHCGAFEGLTLFIPNQKSVALGVSSMACLMNMANLLQEGNIVYADKSFFWVPTSN